MNIVRTPHDEFVKAMMEHPKVAKDFFSHHLPQEIKDTIMLDSLRLEKNSFVDPDLKKHESDLLFSVHMVNHKRALLYTLIEHQSGPDELMPFRLMYYIFQGLKRHVLRHKKKPLPLPLVYPIVLYNGMTPYHSPKEIFPLFGSLESLAREVFLTPFKLVDVAKLSDDDIRKHKWAGLMELSLKRAKHLQFEAWIQFVNERLEAIKVDVHDNIVHIMLQYGFRKYENAECSPKNYLDTVKLTLAPRYEENIMTIEEALKQVFKAEAQEEGRAIGLAEGRAEGLTQGRAEAISHTLHALELIKSGISIAEISKRTELSHEDIEKLRQTILQ